MGYRWLRIPLYGACALSMTLASSVPSSAQTVTRTSTGYYDRYDRYAFDNGYTAGAREGERDARDNHDYGFKRDDTYEDADAGYRGGDRNRYRDEFRHGYEVGYDRAYRRYAREGWSEDHPIPPPVSNYPTYPDRPGTVVTVPVPIYHENVNSRIAYENGFRDGADEGRKDFERRRAFEPTRRDRYKDGDRGYEDRFGSRDEYKADYRAGFRAGYEEAYRTR